ncbi:MAG: TM2 domain-containing protein [Planctomycetes bacterium]|nr:TM2 domain-containing protein [Planctomycetota bacterium]
MKLQCPKCSNPMSAPDNAAGMTVQCPSCTHQFTAGGTPQAKVVGPGAAEARRSCPLCQQPVAAGAVKCPHCKGVIGTVQCPACAEAIPADAAVCPRCNSAVQPQVASGAAYASGPGAPANKIVCGLLAILVPIGIHRFLMGYPGIGVAQLLLSFCFIGCIWSWIDGILILTDNLKMADGRPLVS